MKRRSTLFGGAAVAAGLAGAGAAWWRARRTDGAADTTAIWALRFDTPDGTPLALANFRGRPLLLNFWATWCPPCVSEMPLIDRFQRAHQARGWHVVGLAVDQIAPVRTFLAQHPVSYPIGLAGFDGVDLSRRMGNPSGALPFSLVFDRSGAVLERRLGVIRAQDLQRWADAAG